MANFYDTWGGSDWPQEEGGTVSYAQQLFQSVDDLTFDAIFDDHWFSSGLDTFDATTANCSLQPYLDPLSAAIPDMIQTQFLDTAAAQHLEHRGFLASMSSQAILPRTDLIINPFDIDHNSWDIMSMPLSSETISALTTSCTTPGAPDPPAHRLSPPSLPNPQEKHHKCPIDGCGRAFAKAGQLNAHRRRHTNPETCPHCSLRLPDKKGLGRHISAKHSKDLEGLVTDQRECPHPNCRHTGREDNISRHYLKKHRGRLRWKRGKATVISG